MITATCNQNSKVKRRAKQMTVYQKRMGWVKAESGESTKHLKSIEETAKTNFRRAGAGERKRP